MSMAPRRSPPWVPNGRGRRAAGRKPGPGHVPNRETDRDFFTMPMIIERRQVLGRTDEPIFVQLLVEGLPADPEGGRRACAVIPVPGEHLPDVGGLGLLL